MVTYTCECFCGCIGFLYARSEIDELICDFCIDGFHYEDDNLEEEMSWLEDE